MTRKEPTPIRKPHYLVPARSDKPPIPMPTDEPQPLTFPKPALTDEQLRNLVAVYVARVLHKTALRLSEAEIVMMSEEEFEAFCRSVLEDDA